MCPTTNPIPEALLDARTMLDSLADGVYATDIDRRIVFWNRAAERITGYRAEEVLGSSCSCNLLVHEDKDGRRLCGEEHCPLHRAIVTGHASEKPLLVRARSKTGERIPTEVTVAPLRDRGGRIVGGIETFRDITPVFDSLTQAATIQRAALDCSLPFEKRLRCSVQCTPNDYVGGDFYRVERLGGERYALMIADVVGQGLPAALRTMQLRSMWEELQHLLAEPAALLGAMHERLRALVHRSDYFATAMHAVIDLERATLTYATAGHPPPLLRRADEPRFSQLEATGGMPLGVCVQCEQANLSADLGCGDTLLLHTDTVTQLEDHTTHTLGIDGLLDLLEQVEFDGTRNGLRRIEETLLSFSDGLSLGDDLTLLCAQL
jgi:sigma-B regulation protein RsbU (phosphoserine phosphatase)